MPLEIQYTGKVFLDLGDQGQRPVMSYKSGATCREIYCGAFFNRLIDSVKSGYMEQAQQMLYHLLPKLRFSMGALVSAARIGQLDEGRLTRLAARLTKVFPTCTFTVLIEKDDFRYQDNRGILVEGDVDAFYAWWWVGAFVRALTFTDVTDGSLREMLVSSPLTSSMWASGENDKKRHIAVWDEIMKGAPIHPAKMLVYLNGNQGPVNAYEYPSSAEEQWRWLSITDSKRALANIKEKFGITVLEQLPTAQAVAQAEPIADFVPQTRVRRRTATAAV